MAGRDLGLNATRAARRLYLSLKFTAEAVVYQCQGRAAQPPEVAAPEGAVLRSVEPDDLDAIAAVDRLAFGADRTALLARLLQCSRGVVLTRAGRLDAFALCRPFGRGHVVGPVVAPDDADAMAVLRPHVVDHVGRFLRLDTRQKQGAFATFLSRCGLPVYDTVTTMSLGRPWYAAGGPEPERRQTTYGLASQALG
jgi:hypothetical protein